MTNDKSKWAETAFRLNAAFYKVVSVRNTTFLFWAALAIYFFFTRFVPHGMIEHRGVVILARTLFLATIGLWMFADGRAHGIEEKWLGQYFIGSLMPALIVIALPIYMVHSRGWLGAGISTLRFAAYFLLAAVIWYGVVGILLMFGIHETGTPSINF